MFVFLYNFISFIVFLMFVYNLLLFHCVNWRFLRSLITVGQNGFQILEELQCELREKSHLAHQLRTQLEYSDRHHEEALAALSAERDTLRAHLNMLREESSSLGAVRRDYEEACERLCGAERALGDARRDRDAARRDARALAERVALLETEKLTLQELLSKSKEECHRINDMYASRQSTLLVENETLRTENAHLTARLQDQDEFMQHIIKEKDLLEMELKDMLNKSNQTHMRLDRSIDVSYTEDQMLTALDTLNADSRFTQEQSSVSTQADIPCTDCTSRLVPHRSLGRYIWESLKCAFQLLAALCFVCALGVLGGALSLGGSRSCRGPLPWRWLQPHDFVDLLLSVEYVADVPM
ncbi:uncharacterized protein LOC124534431 isoform X2 [Vanessa cardui]|uniref:uncharacterized protein LOC124534431 isoform X2 n=1 Tax=Vanessa cardui TaxID=171605 RepID=UPI001F137437|nr:uncharacterized protein LOC124534431 isoform X2 [Vanessa cardui]